MSEFYYQGLQIEIDIMFPGYSIKFSSNQSYLEPAPVSTLFFQRFSDFSEYPSLQNFNMQERLCAQLLSSEESAQTELQKVFCSNLAPKSPLYKLIVAEAINESAELVYLIIDFNRNYSAVGSVYNTLSLFRFSFSELWNIPSNALAHVKNLQLTNSWMSKQIHEFCGYLDYFKQNASYWHMLALVKDNQLEKVTKEVEKPKKIVKKIIAKSEVPTFDCLLCCDNMKNVVFLPCGHVVACKTCTIDSLDIELGKVMNQRRSPRSCPVCKQTIKEAREVFL